MFPLYPLCYFWFCFNSSATHLLTTPKSWCQVAAEVMPPGSLIVGVDLAPIKAIPRCITFQSDITSDKCRATLRQHLKTWKADTVLHDGAPNVGTAWVQDAYSQAELALQALKLATVFLVEGGTFVTKVFRSKDYNSLIWVFNQLFNKVEATKPPSSRNVSAEIFVVCRGYKAPKNLDPKFLDPRSVFAELSAPTPNNEAKVFNPEKKKRKREGYEEGDWTQFKEIPAIDFINTADPIAMLANTNKFSLEQQQPDGDIAQATLSQLPETTEEIRRCCADLKVLGRKEFRMLLKWRLKVQDIFGLSAKKKAEAQAEAEAEAAQGTEVAEVTEMDEELRIQEELRKMKEKESALKKKARKRENERKQKDIVRIQLNMTTPMELGLEQAGPVGEDGVFALKTITDSDVARQIAKGKMYSVAPAELKERAEDDEEESDSDEDGDNLERQLDSMYDTYQERRSENDAKYRAKKIRKQYEDDEEWGGITDEKEPGSQGEDSDDDLMADADDDGDVSDSEAGPRATVTDLDNSKPRSDGLSRRAATFFDQDMFKDVAGLDESDEESDSTLSADEPSARAVATTAAAVEESEDDDEDEDSDAVDGSDSDSDSDSDSFEVVKADHSEWDNEHVDPTTKRTKIDIVTAEAMTLAQNLASGKVTKASIEDETFNKYAHRDTDGLPDWFLDDEGKHSKPHRPITKEGAAAIKEKLRALNARPIKKVQEAQARKKFKTAQRLEKLKRKSALLLEDDGVTERDKAKEITKLMAKANKKKPKRQVKVVVAKGGNKGLKGRPKGTKGRYKMVDPRMKKDMRALKRIAKR